MELFIPPYVIGNATLWLVTLGRVHGPVLPDPERLGLNSAAGVLGLIELIALGVWFQSFFG